jgi:hypothetical protein
MARVENTPFSPVGNRTILLGNISGRFRSSRQSGSWQKQFRNPVVRFFLRLIGAPGGGTLAWARFGADPPPRPRRCVRCARSARDGITCSQQAVTCATLLGYYSVSTSSLLCRLACSYV